jgi:hypothetical protein
MGAFIGLDVSLSKTAVCVVDRDGRGLWQGKVPSEPGPLIARLAEWWGSIDLAGIEACPMSEWLHRGLREAGIRVRPRTEARSGKVSPRSLTPSTGPMLWCRGSAPSWSKGHPDSADVRSDPSLHQARPALAEGQGCGYSRTLPQRSVFGSSGMGW